MVRRPDRGRPSQHITSGWRDSSAGRSTYLDISAYGEEARQRPAIPAPQDGGRVQQVGQPTRISLDTGRD